MSKNPLKKLLVFLLLILLFSATLPFRLPYINSQTGPSDECHLNMLIILKTWERDGALTHKLSPVITFANKGDKFVHFFKRLESAQGDNYYVSYPPLIYMITYPVVKAFGMEHAKVTIQIMNLLFHLFSCLLIFMIVLDYFRKKFETFFLPAALAFIIYAFAPVMLALHTHIYFPEMLGQMMFVVVLFYTQRLFQKKPTLSLNQLLLFGMLLFLLIYSEWIGVFYVFVLLVFLYFRKWPYMDRRVWLCIIGSSMVALLMIFIQYASIAGGKGLLESFFMRYADRSGFFPKGYFNEGDNIYNMGTYAQYFQNLLHGLGWFGAFGLLMFFLWIFSNKGISRSHQLFNNIIVVMSVFPVLISLMVFFNASALHFHYMAKLMVPLSLGAGILFYRLQNRIPSLKRVTAAVSVGLLLIISCVSINQFCLSENEMLGETNQPQMHRVADFIKETASTDEVIFLNYKPQGPQPYIYLSVLTERSIITAETALDAQTRLQNYPQNKAVYIEINESTGKFMAEHIVKEKVN